MPAATGVVVLGGLALAGFMALSGKKKKKDKGVPPPPIFQPAPAPGPSPVLEPSFLSAEQKKAIDDVHALASKTEQACPELWQLIRDAESETVQDIEGGFDPKTAYEVFFEAMVGACPEVAKTGIPSRDPQVIANDAQFWIDRSLSRCPERTDDIVLNADAFFAALHTNPATAEAEYSKLIGMLFAMCPELNE